jgi:hypothetical protein
MTALHLAGSQVGVGTKNFTFNTEAQKRMLCITKKSGVIVESKEIPVAVLDTNDVIPLGQIASVIGAKSPITLQGYTNWDSAEGKELAINKNSNDLYGIHDGTEYLPRNGIVGLAADLAQTTGAKLTYNGNNSFTIAVTDSTLSVYVYVDMLVLGGSASGRNVSVNLAGTDLVSTDAEGAILEVYEKVREGLMPELDFANAVQLTSTAYVTTKKGAMIASGAPSSMVTVTADGIRIATISSSYSTNACVHFIPIGTSLTSSDSTTAKFVPYK